MGRPCVRDLQKLSREDAAASVQAAAEHVICRALATHWMRNTGLGALALSGGVFSNVRLNRAVLETTAAQNVFIFPPWATKACRSAPACFISTRATVRAAGTAIAVGSSDVYLGRDYDARFPAAARRHPDIIARRRSRRSKLPSKP